MMFSSLEFILSNISLGAGLGIKRMACKRALVKGFRVQTMGVVWLGVSGCALKSIWPSALKWMWAAESEESFDSDW